MTVTNTSGAAAPISGSTGVSSTPKNAPSSPVGGGSASTPAVGKRTSDWATAVRDGIAKPTTSSAPIQQSIAADLDEAPEMPVDVNEEFQVEATEVEQQVDENNPYAWLDPYKDGIHGVQLQELLAALANGTIPESLFDKLRIKLKNGNQEWEDTISGARNGAMMRDAFNKKTQAVAERSRQLDAAYQEFGDYVNGWSDPSKFLMGARQMKLPVEHMAYLVVEQMAHRDALNQASPGAGDEWYEVALAKAEHESLKSWRAKQEQQAQKQQQTAKEKQTFDAIKGVAAGEMQRLGQRWDRARWNAFTHLVSGHFEEHGGAPKSQDVRRYVQEANAMIEEALGARQAPPAPGVQRQGLAPNSPARNSPSSSAQPQKRLTSAQMADRMRNR